MIPSIFSVVCVAILFAYAVCVRERPFSEDFELNPIYHTPLPEADTAIKLYADIELSIAEIQRTMQMATIYARPDYALAKNHRKYEKILNSKT